MTNPKVAFIGAGSTVFMKNIVGDILQRKALAGAEIALMDINPRRLAESEIVARKLVATLDVPAQVTTTMNQREALDRASFVIVAFQIGGYDPCTITDFEVPKRYGLRHTIADTLGVGGIMRGLRTVPHLWTICEDMLEVCPEAVLLQYVNPMAINTWAIAERYPAIKQVGLCHSVQSTAAELAHDLGIPVDQLRYRAAGINHMAFYLQFEQRLPDGSFKNLYPDLLRGYLEGRLPKTPNRSNPRCPNTVRYEMLKRLGYFVTESSEHFAEYTPYFIKRGRDDLIERYGVPLDEYPKRCIEQSERWEAEAERYRTADRIEVVPSHEYASSIIHSIWTGEPSVIYGNVRNHGCISSLPDACAVEVPCLVDDNGVQPTHVGTLPPQLTALIRTNVNVQELTVAALMAQDREHLYHAAMLDPHTAADLDLDQIWTLVDDLLVAHGDWIPGWARPGRQHRAL
jgi:alpha-galactosidase